MASAAPSDGQLPGKGAEAPPIPPGFKVVALAASAGGVEAFGVVLALEVRDDDIRVTTVVQGTAQGAGMGSTDWEWDPELGAAALKCWTELGLMNQAIGRYAGQEVQAIGDVHLFIVTRPRTQKMDTVYCRSF